MGTEWTARGCGRQASQYQEGGVPLLPSGGHDQLIWIIKRGDSLAVQWLGLCTFTAVGIFPDRETKILKVRWCGQKKREKNQDREVC